jgi:hypothetical protein
VMQAGVIQTVDEVAARETAQAYGARLYREGVALWKEVSPS